MVRRVLVVGIILFFGLRSSYLLASEEAPIPPAPAAEIAEDSDATAGEASTDQTTGEVVTPVPIPDAPQPEIVPVEATAEESEDEADLSLQVGPVTIESSNPDCWVKPGDFATVRWWPSQSRMEWKPGHRDRFGMFSLVGQHATKWEKWNGLSSTSGYGYHFLNGPVQTDLPSKLFDFTWGLHWMGDLTPRWSASFSGKVGLFTDFEDSVRDGWRFPAHGVFFYEATEEVHWVIGGRYFDRENLPALPVGGVIFQPDENVRIEAVFPEPRFAWRVNHDESSENWLSFSGEIGGGEWAIERSNSGLADVVTYNDYSAVLGLHYHKYRTSENAFEIGYTFYRDLEYRSNVGNFEPDETFFIRMSSRY